MQSIQSIQAISSIRSIHPVGPVDPIDAVDPVDPIAYVDPVDPVGQRVCPRLAIPGVEHSLRGSRPCLAPARRLCLCISLSVSVSVSVSVHKRAQEGETDLTATTARKKLQKTAGPAAKRYFPGGGGDTPKASSIFIARQ